MPYILSIGTSTPPYTITQNEAKQLIQHIFPREKSQIERLLPVFDHAKIEERQFVVPIDWFKETHTLSERNQIYIEEAANLSVQAIQDCLSSSFLKEEIHPNEIDCILFISSTGISTPTIDTYCINSLSFRDDIVRMPLWGLGCCGGASGIARGSEWLKANQTKSVLVINLEFCSLAFQLKDKRTSNFVGTALFGDGVACSLLIGDESELRKKARNNVLPFITESSSRTKKGTMDVMGWDVKDSGFHVIFAKSIPQLVNTFWQNHINEFGREFNFDVKECPFIVSHPGGAKVLEAMESVLDCSSDRFKFSYDVLRRHGNMSSPTVIYVMKEVMQYSPPEGTKSLLTALGPGFSSEIIKLEWISK